MIMLHPCVVFKVQAAPHGRLQAQRTAPPPPRQMPVVGRSWCCVHQTHPEAGPSSSSISKMRVVVANLPAAQQAQVLEPPLDLLPARRGSTSEYSTHQSLSNYHAAAASGAACGTTGETARSAGLAIARSDHCGELPGFGLDCGGCQLWRGLHLCQGGGRRTATFAASAIDPFACRLPAPSMPLRTRGAWILLPAHSSKVRPASAAACLCCMWQTLPSSWCMHAALCAAVHAALPSALHAACLPACRAAEEDGGEEGGAQEGAAGRLLPAQL